MVLKRGKNRDEPELEEELLALELKGGQASVVLDLYGCWLALLGGARMRANGDGGVGGRKNFDSGSCGLRFTARSNQRARNLTGERLMEV